MFLARSLCSAAVFLGMYACVLKERNRRGRDAAGRGDLSPLQKAINGHRGFNILALHAERQINNVRSSPNPPTVKARNCASDSEPKI